MEPLFICLIGFVNTCSNLFSKFIFFGLSGSCIETKRAEANKKLVACNALIKMRHIATLHQMVFPTEEFTHKKIL
jgi:hypothetical protein